MGKLFKRSKSKGGDGGSAAAAAHRAADSDSDISLMSDSDDSLAEERAALRSALAGTSSGPSRAALAAASTGSEAGVGGSAAAARLSTSGTADPFDHASMWAEVDTEALDRLALAIARNVVPPPPVGAGQEGAEAAAQRLTISAAVAEQAEARDSADPLGYGRIDLRTLTLVREDGSAGSGPAAKQRYASRASALDALGAGRRPGGALASRGSQRGGAEEGGAPEAPPALRARCLPGSEQFDPELYLATLHAGTALPELQRGLASLRRQLGEHTGALKALVKENFDRFISSKTTIDGVYAQLQRAESEGEAGVHGASTTEVLDSLAQVQGEARRAFGPLLDRAAKADRLRLVLGAMRRYEALVGLPARARQHAEAGDYEQVASDYRRARALLADQAPGGGGGGRGQGAAAAPGGQGGMWAKLMGEIDRVAGSAAHSLDTVVRSVASGPGEALDAIRHLLALRAVGVPAAQGMDPVSAYVEAQERHVRAMLEGRQAQHAARLEALRRQQRESAEYEAQVAALAGLGIGSPAAAAAGRQSPATASPAASAPPSVAATPRGAGGSSQEVAAAAEAAAVRYVSLITAAMCQWLPGFWAVTQQRLPALAAASDAAAAEMIERGMAAAERTVGALLAAYRAAVQGVLADPPAAGLTHAGLLSVAAELAAGCEALQTAAAAAAGSNSGRSPAGAGAGSAAVPPPPAAIECLQALTEQAVLASLAQLAAHLQEAVALLCAGEDYRLTPASRRAGAPATASVAALQALVQQGMAHLQTALAEAARAEVQPLKRSAAPARAAFLACFSAYAAGCDALAAAIQQGQHGSGGGQHSLAAEAATAAAVAGSTSRDGSAPAPLSPTRRLLVLCANLGAVRGRLLPQQFARWGGLLQAGGAARELQAEAAAAAAELEAVETRLAGAYVERKQALLDEAMEQLLFADGTAWEAALPPSGLRPAALELLHALVAVQAELVAVAPGLLGEAMEELLLGLLDGFAQVLSDGSLPASPGGVAQLWLEGSVLLEAVGGLGGEPLQAAGARLRAALDQRLEAAVAAAAAAGGSQAAELAAWSAGGRGAAGRPTLPACRQRLQALQEGVQAQARCNLLPLRQLGL